MTFMRGCLDGSLSGFVSRPAQRDPRTVTRCRASWRPRRSTGIGLNLVPLTALARSLAPIAGVNYPTDSAAGELLAPDVWS